MEAPSSNSVYLLHQSVIPDDCTYSCNLVGNGMTTLPTATAFQQTKTYKSQQDLFQESEPKVSQKTNEFSSTSWFSFKDTEKSHHNNQEVNKEDNNNNNFINDRNYNNKDRCRKRWKSETELRKISNSSNLFLGSLLNEVVGDAKVSRYLKTGEAFNFKDFSFFTLKGIFSAVVTFVSFTYAAFFLYLLTQTKDPYILASSIHPVFPSLLEEHSKEVLEDLEVGHCELKAENVAKKMDIFLLGHVLGYAGKMILFRDFGFTWLISITWEFTEIFYTPILPNFIECWWDTVLFDICICNAAGILTGFAILRWLGIPQLNWFQSSCHHPQNTPPMPRWRPMLYQACYVFVLLFFCNNAELNSFTLKRVFGVNKNHPLNVIRLLIHAFMSYNVISGYRKVLRGLLKSSELPVHFWIYLLAICLEFATVLKHGPLYTLNLLPNMASWISMLFVGSILYVILATCANFIFHGTTDCKTE